jgi:hypothetical protein
MRRVCNGLSEEKAARVLIGLREGRTIWRFNVKPTKFDQYCAANPTYAAEAQPLRAVNTQAAKADWASGPTEASKKKP